MSWNCLGILMSVPHDPFRGPKSTTTLGVTSHKPRCVSCFLIKQNQRYEHGNDSIKSLQQTTKELK